MHKLKASVVAFNKLKIDCSNVTELLLERLKIVNGEEELQVIHTITSENCIELILHKEVDIKSECFLYYEEEEYKVCYQKLFSTSSFHEKYYYGGKLGYFYAKEATLFKVWSPAATSISLLLYKNGDLSIKEAPRRILMNENEGLWSLFVKEDLKGFFYTYEVFVYGHLNEAVDPYTNAVGVNGFRGAVVDLSEADPEVWKEDRSPEMTSFTDAIIYETNIRDISKQPESGVKHKGKYLGLTEDGTSTANGLTTSLSHILELGVSHIQLMPVYDFSAESTDEKIPKMYNWGYDPENYNAPEGSYATDPYDPLCRIKELKVLIQHLHSHGLFVNIDVVYNHMYSSTFNHFQKIFPGYYFRFFENGIFSKGSGCGNDTASERLMMRKFMIDSVLYWANEFHIDGFRFDLMGLHDVDTMNLLRQNLTLTGRSIMLYGEGWNLHTNLQDEKKANMFNASKIPDIGHFNDGTRNTIRGSVFDSRDRGFVSGKYGLEHDIKRVVTGSIHYSFSIQGPFDSPVQSINYVDAHDNNTLWDKLTLSCPEVSLSERVKMQKLANAIVLTSQGIPFLHAGVEFCRTKQGIEDSVRSSDEINWMDWNRKEAFLDVFEYYKSIIKLRKNHPAFRMNVSCLIQKHLVFLDNTPFNTIGFLLKEHANGDMWRDILVVYNANREDTLIMLPKGTWITAIYEAPTSNVRDLFFHDKVNVPSISMMVLYRNEDC